MKYFTPVKVLSLLGLVQLSPIVVDKRNNITYHGVVRNGLEVFLGIRYWI